jgi:cell fate regulator YaaT (PSP1 superfamily)
MSQKFAIKLRKHNRICPITGYKEENIKVCSPVIIQTDRGQEFGCIVSFASKYPSNVNHDVKLKKVVRYATPEDLKIVNNLPEMEKNALRVAIDLAKKYELPIKIVDAEYLFDAKKIHFYYKIIGSKNIPNLKNFRKDLSKNLNAEITLRIVTPRDEAKFQNGLGPCGRPLCCATWLGKAKHITVKMVKDQGYQISPSRTSGICGRLMCCFKYELESGEEDD